jgi:hypothetical protein
LTAVLRPLLLIAAGLVLVAMSIGGTLAWIGTSDWRRPDPPLIQNLAGAGSSAQNGSFAVRLKQRFPPGSSEQALGEALRAQGFVQNDWGGRTGSQHNAAWSRGGFPCVTDARVDWTADAQGRLVTIGGLYGYACL